jgi:vacuolar-type H+-ATPase subunit B/Vma2
MMTLVRGQKLPIFSVAGLPHALLAAQIAKQAKVVGSAEAFAVVFAAVGVTADEANFFQKSLQESGAIARSALYLNLASDPAPERVITVRVALTAAEYLAFELGMHVLVIITDMTNYALALRELSGALDEVPGRKAFPGYLYSDLASLYERAGRIKGRKGSVTQVPILTMPNNDLTHPVPDLTGYITEGQIVYGPELNKAQIYPPVRPLSSLSRLMSSGVKNAVEKEEERIACATSIVKVALSGKKITADNFEDTEVKISKKTVKMKPQTVQETLRFLLERGVLQQDAASEGNAISYSLKIGTEEEIRRAIEAGRIPKDLGQVSNMLYKFYSEGVQARKLSKVVGRAAMEEKKKRYMKFADEFERKYLAQSPDEERTFDDTAKLGWELLSIIPRGELTDVSEELIRAHYSEEIFQKGAD